MLGFGESTTSRRLRDLIGDLESRVAKLEANAPAVTASLLEANDKLARSSARWEKAMSRKAALERGPDDPDEAELDEVWNEVHRR